MDGKIKYVLCYPQTLCSTIDSSSIRLYVLLKDKIISSGYYYLYKLTHCRKVVMVYKFQTILHILSTCDNLHIIIKQKIPNKCFNSKKLWARAMLWRWLRASKVQYG